MANTLNLGNGQWATKDESVLAYNNENNNFKPLPFDFSRGSTATVVNKDGLIETVGTKEPRIDFQDNAKGSLLLEPTSTNLITQSEAFDNSYWTKNGSSVVSGFVSPSADSPLGAFKLVEDTSNGNHRIDSQSFSVSPSGSISISLILKYDGSTQWVKVRDFATNAYVFFNLLNNSIGNTNLVNGSQKIVDLGNDFKRVSFTYSSTLTSAMVRIYLADSGTSDGYAGNGTSGVYIFGAQLEQKSYATSYIPTQGGVVTRLQDDFDCSLPDTDSFNSSTGFSVITKFGIGQANGSTSVPFLQFNDDTSGTYIGFGSNASTFRARLNLSGTAYLNTLNAPRTQENNLFMSCDSSGWSQGANGSVGYTGTNDASVFDRLPSISINVTEIYGIIKIKEILIYNTRLTDTELEELTR